MLMHIYICLLCRKRVSVLVLPSDVWVQCNVLVLVFFVCVLYKLINTLILFLELAIKKCVVVKNVDQCSVAIGPAIRRLGSQGGDPGLLYGFLEDQRDEEAEQDGSVV